MPEIISESGSPAAAEGDEAGHGTEMGHVEGGSSIFTVGGRPAARAGIDYLTCEHHVTTPITTGSSTVKWDGHPAARVGDPSQCQSTILTGNPRVLIGGPSIKVINCTCTPEAGYRYSEHTLDYLRENRCLILMFSDDMSPDPRSVTPVMLAGAVADEYNRRVWDGRFADFGNTLQANLPGGALEWTDKTLEGMKRMYINSGPGNIKVGTALNTALQHEQEFRAKMGYYGPIDFKNMASILLEDRGTFLIASLNLRDINNTLIQNKFYMEPSVDSGHHPEDWAAVVVSAYREGPDYLKRAKDNRSSPVNHRAYQIEAGSGCGVCLQSRIIANELGII